jgi:hypothetical protein
MEFLPALYLSAAERRSVAPTVGEANMYDANFG